MNTFLKSLIVLTMTSPVARASGTHTRKDRLSPAKRQAIEHNYASYQTCRKNVLDKARREKLNSSAIKNALTICGERFPAAEVFRQCKTDALTKFRNNRTSAQNALKYCNLILSAATYD